MDSNEHEEDLKEEINEIVRKHISWRKLISEIESQEDVSDEDQKFCKALNDTIIESEEILEQLKEQVRLYSDNRDPREN